MLAFSSLEGRGLSGVFQSVDCRANRMDRCNLSFRLPGGTIAFVPPGFFLQGIVEGFRSESSTFFLTDECFFTFRFWNS